MKQIGIVSPGGGPTDDGEPPGPDGATCPDCFGRGWVETAEGRMRPCACRSVGAMSRAVERAGVPPRYRRFTRQSWEARYGPWARSGLPEAFLSWPSEDPEEWLIVLYGRYGRRKTSLGTALFLQALGCGLSGAWIDMNDWLDELEAGISDGRTSALYMAVRNAEVLLIDDLGSIRGARGVRRQEDQGWWREKVAALLRFRESWLLPTIITSNLTGPAEGAPRESFFPAGLGVIDRSLVSRLDVRLAIELDGPDHRITDRETAENPGADKSQGPRPRNGGAR